MNLIRVLQKRVPTASFQRVLLAVAFLSSAAACLFALFGVGVLREGSIGKHLMTDYWETVRYALSSAPYGEELHASYTPVAFIILYPFALICKSVAFSLPAAECVRTLEFQLSFWSFFLLCAVGCTYFMVRLARGGKTPTAKQFFIGFAIFLCSAPVYFTVARANVIIAALLFLLLFLNFYNSEIPTLRYLAYLSLAISGGIKFYTLVFVVLLVRKGRMQDCLKVLAFFILVTFAPFLFYGKEGFWGWITHMHAFLTQTGTSVQFHNISCVQLVFALFDKLHQTVGLPLGVGVRVVTVILQFIFGIVCLFCSVFTKSDRRAFRIATLLCCMIANPSYFYIAIFLYPLIFIDLQQESMPLPLCFVYLVLACCLTLVKWWAAIPHCVILLAYALVVIFLTLREIFKAETPKSLRVLFCAIIKGFRHNKIK